MTRFSTAARRAGLSALLVAGATLGTATVAAAAPATPSDCSVSTVGSTATAYCRAGTGEYRATTRCDKNNWPDYNRYGAWVTPGRWSFADCNSGDRPFNPG